MGYYFGDALSEIKQIKGTVDGHLDMSTVPTFAKRNIKKDIKELVQPLDKHGKPLKDQHGEILPPENVITGQETIEGRDLGAMVSMLTVAVQQLLERIEILEKGK
jgi:hypothetical protein